MVDFLSGAASLIVAVIELARRDAVEPKLCPTEYRDQVRGEAAEFLAVVVEPAAAECLQDVIVPHRRQRYAAGPRWEFNETDASRRMWRSRNEE